MTEINKKALREYIYPPSWGGTWVGESDGFGDGHGLHEGDG